MKNLVLKEYGMAHVRKSPMTLVSFILLTLLQAGAIVFIISVATSPTAADKGSGILVGVFAFLLFFCLTWLPVLLKMNKPSVELKSDDGHLVILKGNKEKMNTEWTRIQRIAFGRQGNNVTGIGFIYLNETGRKRFYNFNMSFLKKEDTEKVLAFLSEECPKREVQQ